jgi:hypothetical protein
LALVGHIIVTIMFGFFCFICFYYTFRAYKQDDKTYVDIFPHNTFIYSLIMFQFILWVCKKIFPQHRYIQAFRVITFIYGLLIIGAYNLYWTL